MAIRVELKVQKSAVYLYSLCNHQAKAELVFNWLLEGLTFPIPQDYYNYNIIYNIF